jgi:hypothetical protein
MARKRDRGLEALKRSIIAAHSPGHDPAWWVETHEFSIMLAFATAGVRKIADPFILGTGFDPVECSGGGFLPQERSRFAELVGEGEPLPVPAADHFGVGVVLEGEVYHAELPIPTPAVMARSFKAV